MNRKRVSAITLTLLFIGMLTLAFNIQQATASLPVHNIDTDEYFATIQGAIDDPDTKNGHRIVVEAGVYYEHVSVYKSLIIIGKNKATTIIDGSGSGDIVTVDADMVTMSGFTLRNGDYGIYLDDSNNCNIYDNIASNNYCGIYVYCSDYNVVSGNIVSSNRDRGIYICASDFNTIRGNIASNNKWVGIYIDHYSDNNTVSSNIASSNQDGIRVEYHSMNNVILGNNASNNTWLGIYVWMASNNTISSNTALKNSLGIRLDGYCAYCTICGNNVSNNDLGMDLEESTNTTICANIISNNNRGIWLSYGSTYSNVYHNNFINNTQQVVWATGLNIWDDGYPSGGNYWSDYTGVDLYSGPSQNETGSDGLGDTPYVIDAYNRDRYPLIKPYPWDPHDIGITNIAASKTVTGQGFSTHINITIFNYGDNTETFNLTAYANTTIIATMTNITLTNRNSVTITFTWNTTGFAKGNYTISAHAEPVEGETDIEDNNCTDGWIFVGWPGDLDADGDVDEDDLWHFCGAFIDYYKIHVLDPNCDFNNDCKIDEDDLWTFCAGFIEYYKSFA